MTDKETDPPKHVEDEFREGLEDHVARVKAELAKRHRELEKERDAEH